MERFRFNYGLAVLHRKSHFCTSILSKSSIELPPYYIDPVLSIDTGLLVRTGLNDLQK